MFSIDLNITAIPLNGKNLFKALFSMNTHHVATPELGLANARSYVFFIRDGSRLSAYIGIYLLHAGRKLFYPYSGNPFLENEIGNVEEEARNFVEDLGAMLDGLDCGRMSDLEKDQWIEAQEVFSRVSAPEIQPEAPPAVAPRTEAPQAPLAAQIPLTPPAPAAQPAPVPPVIAAAQPAQASAAPSPAPAIQPVEGPVQTQVAQPREPAAPAAAVPDVEPPLPPQAPPQPEPLETTLVAAAETREKIIHKAVKAGVVKAQPKSSRQETCSPTGVVSRDREALARLLTSF